LAKAGILFGRQCPKKNKILINFEISILNYNILLFVSKRIVVEKEPQKIIKLTSSCGNGYLC